MGEGDNDHHQQHQFLVRHHPTLAQSRPNSRLKGGEIVEVQGGHIVRATGRKDRHSKVCTSKGTRDRRVRLAAHTAIQFYDVQDRLGYDRPSKAVDWLLRNAKAAIDELADLPPWLPTATGTPVTASGIEAHDRDLVVVGDSGEKALGVDEPSVAAPAAASPHGFGNSISFLPPSMDSDSIADTIKSFFPMPVSSGPAVGFQSYTAEAAHQAQDLRLSLQSFRDHQILHHHHHNHSGTTASEQTFFSSSTPLVFDSNSIAWSEQQPRLVQWTSPPENGGGGGGYVFNSPLPQQQGVPVLDQSPFLTQRGTLQSSNNSPSILAWMEPLAAAGAEHQAAAAAQAFAAASGGFSGFHIPARIQGEEERDKLSYASRR